MKGPYLSRRESIILSTIEIIDELGINGLSTREIARRQGISDAALYKHFKSKEEIILEVLDYYSKFDKALMKTVKNNNMCPVDGIIFFISYLCENFEGYPALTAIMFSYELLLMDIVPARKVIKIMNSRENFINTLLRDGQKKGDISIFFSAEDITAFVMGMFKNKTLRWRINGFNGSLKENIVPALEKMLRLCSMADIEFDKKKFQIHTEEEFL